MSRFTPVVLLFPLVFTSFAFADVSVGSPGNGSQVSSPIQLSASATTCASEPVTAIGYSLDSSTDTTIVDKTSVSAQVPASPGAHTLHVKAWNTTGGVCVSDVTVTVVASSSGSAADGITVNSPAQGATVATPFELTANASTCSGESVTSLGYSLDSSANTTIVHGPSMSEEVPAAAGAHTLHVKSWGNQGAGCAVAVPITVTATPAATTAATTGSGITVSSPATGATVSSPFTLTASASSCDSHSVSAVGYSLDNSSQTTIVDSTTVGATVSAAAGAHTLHVKSWGSGGGSCAVAVAITVSGSSSTAASSSSSDGITVSSPGNGSSVSSPFTLSATAPTCSSQPVTSMGYSLDSSSDTTIISGTSMNTQVTAASGAHTLHVKSWGNQGAGCASSVGISVSGGSTTTSSSSTPTAPSGALTVSSIQTLSDWTATHDTAASGSASGTTSLVTSPTLSGNSRKFVTQFTSNGNERYSASFSDDTTSTNFLYDGWVYIPSSTGSIANIEMDMNQTMSSGETIIFGFQCDGWNGTWDYTINAGSAKSPVDKWSYTSQTCNPANWSRNTWHHVQVTYSHTSSGSVTYHSVWLDGKEQALNVTGFAGFTLGWGSALVTNFQVDGRGSGTATVYLDKLTVSRW
jgi:hypothetical protein